MHNAGESFTMNTKKVTRLEIIDHTPCWRCNGTGHVDSETDSAAGQSIAFSIPCVSCDGRGCDGREVIVHNPKVQIDVELQDDERTLKVFIHERYEDADV